MNIILFGPPGAGKGTQSDFIVKRYNLFHLSTGNLLRSEIEKKSPLGEKISAIVNKGSLVSDDIVSTLIKNIVTTSEYKKRIIFDGYPRTINQAKNLEKLLNSSDQKVDFVFFLNVKKDSIIKRLEKRKILEKRSDDDLETILKRYDTYMEVTKPVLKYYSKNNNFHEVDGSMEIINISQKIEEILNV